MLMATNEPLSLRFHVSVCYFVVLDIPHDKLNVWRTRKKSEPQMRFEPTTLRDLVGCSNH